MPNWVYNYIKVHGKDEELKNFKEDVALNNDVVFSFEKFEAKPEDTSSWAAEGFPGWYIWGLEKWGTKWDCWDSKLNEEKDYLKYKFITAWNAPYPIYEKMIETYKKLNFNIDVWESVNYWTVEITTSGGEYTKYNFQDTALVHWKKNLYIDFEYIEDVLNDNNIEIIKSEIYKKDENLTASIRLSGSNKSYSHNASAGYLFDDLDDDDILAGLEHM
jgi:hypothetical protein